MTDRHTRRGYGLYDSMPGTLVMGPRTPTVRRAETPSDPQFTRQGGGLRLPKISPQCRTRKLIRTHWKGDTLGDRRRGYGLYDSMPGKLVLEASITFDTSGGDAQRSSVPKR